MDFSGWPQYDPQTGATYTYRDLGLNYNPDQPAGENASEPVAPAGGDTAPQDEEKEKVPELEEKKPESEEKTEPEHTALLQVSQSVGAPEPDDAASLLQAPQSAGAPEPAERLMSEWRELIPDVSRVRIMSDAKRMEAFCPQVGCQWPEEIHHMNGNLYLVVENSPPDTYVVYDPVFHQRGIQDGRIHVPFQGVVVEEEQEEEEETASE
jgi:hypothetical protein